MIRLKLAFSFSLLLGQFAFSQNSDPERKNADCPKAREISILDIYRPQLHPKGHGNIYEYENEVLLSLERFEIERNSAWYTFTIPADGFLGMDIVPDTITDDHDFILYRYSGRGFCDSLKNRLVKPVRTCISQNDPTLRGWTGMKQNTDDTLIHSGPGPSYVKEINVIKGERYILIVDNCYSDSSNHTLIFRYQVPVTITGVILEDSSQKPLAGKVRITNNETGKLVAEAETDPKTGGFFISARLDYMQNYDIIAGSGNHFIHYETISPKRADQRKIEMKAILQKLEVGKNFTLEGINFEPNVDILVQPAEPKAQHLLEFMLEFPTVRILIEGHTNCAGNGFGPTPKDQPLSDARSKKIYDILVDGGVHPNRLERIGYGCSRMILPRAWDLADQKVNMRVEIKILEL